MISKYVNSNQLRVFFTDTLIFDRGLDRGLTLSYAFSKEKPRSSAFDKTGWSSGQIHVSERVRSELGVTLPVVVGSVRPTVEELRLCHPRRRTVHERAIWKRKPPAAASAKASTAASSHSTGFGVLATPKPIATRTRSKAAASSSVA